jgi:hypothetical protein
MIANESNISALLPSPLEIVSEYEKTDFPEEGERRSGGKDLDLPARSRFGEGRAVTFSRSDSDVPGV